MRKPTYLLDAVAPLVIDIAEGAPPFMSKICGEAKYKRWFPASVFDAAGSNAWFESVFKV